MRKLKQKKFWSLLGSCLFLTSCATTPPDVPVFENLTQHLSTDPVTQHLILKPSPACMTQIQEIECGHGVYIVSGKEIYVGEQPEHLFNNKKWSDLKAQMVYVPAVESYAPLATYIINSCKKLDCSSDVTKFKVKVDALGVIAK